MLAMVLMPELTKAYNDAPDSPARPMLKDEEEIGIPLFYQIRKLCIWLCSRCYLTHINDMQKTSEDLENFINDVFRSVGHEGEGVKKYAIDTFLPMNALIGPLGIPAYEWLAEIIDLYHEPEEEKYIPILAGMKSRPYEYYRYVTVGDSELVLENVNGDRLTLSASSMPGGKFSPDIIPGRSALLSLVFLDGEWLMNGLGLQGMPPEIFDRCYKSHNMMKKQHKEAYKYLRNAFGKQRIGVCGSYEEYMKLVNEDSIPSLSEDHNLLADIRAAGNLLYFLNTDGTVCILPGMASCVKIKDNPYYNEEEATYDGLSLIFDHSLASSEMRENIIKNKLIPDATLNSSISIDAGRQLFQRNIRFFNDYSNRDTMSIVAGMDS